MEKKGTIVSLIFVFVVVIIVAMFIIISGITANDYNYVQIEVNPRVEFICDKNNKVVSYRPLNDDAKIILSDTNYKGLNIDDASVDFIDQCAKTGYIDVNGENNAVNITIIDGITQALDVHVTQKIYKYLQKNEILCAVVENYEDRSMFDAKKENKICCPNKYKLIKTIMETDANLKFDDLKKLSETKLINMVSNIHSTNHENYSNDNLEFKEKLIELNQEKYDNHIKNISNETQQEFGKTFDKFQKTIGERYRIDFNKEYNNWQNNIVS